MIPKLGHLCWDDRITIFKGRAIVDRCQYMKARRGADHEHVMPIKPPSAPLSIACHQGLRVAEANSAGLSHREVVGRLRGLLASSRKAR